MCTPRAGRENKTTGTNEENIDEFGKQSEGLSLVEVYRLMSVYFVCPYFSPASEDAVLQRLNWERTRQ